MRKPVKVLIVDDSELIRTLLTQILSTDEDIQVVGTAIDPYDARTKIKELSPDVITLDVEMPRMDGLTFLKNLMRLRPIPVVMVSTLTQSGADVTLQALQLGAVEFIPKPKLNVRSELPVLTRDIVEKVKQAASANIRALDRNAIAQAAAPAQLTGSLNNKFDLIAIGASTGGPEATKALLSSLPPKMPPILIAQHMPGGFTRSYAERLNGILKQQVVEFSESSDQLQPNRIYIANGERHLVIKHTGSGYVLYCDDSPPVNRHRPSVDVLFKSVAQAAGKRALGVLLTGMGIDGAAGLKAIRDAGGITIAQDESSSVVWGMPRAAVEMNAASDVLSLNQIGKKLHQVCYEK